MSLFNILAFAVIVVAACYASRCLQRNPNRHLPREIQEELDPFHKQESP